MLKTFLTATAISGLMVSGAMAQAPAQQQQMPPAATQPAPNAQSGQATGMQNPNRPAAGARTQTGAAPSFISAQQANQMLSSEFVGSDVLGPDNEKIGDVTNILFDTEGQIVGIVVGVGGFLGIGQKDVAIDLAAFEVVPEQTRGNQAAAPARRTGENTGTTTMTTTGVTDPNNISLRVAWTKDQLEQAPSFEQHRAQPATTGRTAPTNRTAPTGGATPR